MCSRQTNSTALRIWSKPCCSYVALYHHQLPQSALESKTTMQAMKDWYHSHPHLFNKQPYDRPGCDTSREHASVVVEDNEIAIMQEDQSQQILPPMNYLF